MVPANLPKEARKGQRMIGANPHATAEPPGQAPTDFKPGRKCEKCGGRVSRYQGRCKDVGISVLLCHACQAARLRLDMGLQEFVGKPRNGRGRRPGAKLPGLKSAMKARGVSCAQLGALCGLNGGHVGDLKRLHKGAQPVTVERIAAALGVPVERLKGEG